MAIDWRRGYTAEYYAVLLDPTTWLDGSRFEITDGSIKKTDSELRESADLTCVDRWRRSGDDETGRLQYSFGQGVERWVRIYLDARQDGDMSHVALFTGIASAPNTDITGRRFSNRVQCFSVLKPASDKMLPVGWFKNAGANGAEEVRKLLQVGPAPVYILGSSPGLESNIVAEGGETYLTMAEKILKAIDWRLKITGDGVIYICPKATTISARYDHLENDIIELSVSIENNWYDCPNVFRAMNDESMAVVKDEDPYSMYSIQARGREIWMEEDGVHLSEDENMSQYAQRRLKEEQKINYTMSYDRRFDPSAVPSDIVAIHYPEQDINDTFQITSQSITLNRGAKIGEEVKLWE